MKVNTRKKLFIFMMLLLPIAHFLVFFVYVNINTIIMCFQRWSYSANEIKFVGFDNFKQLFNDISTKPILKKAITNSLLFIPVTNGILLPLSLVSAYILFKKVFLYKFYRTVFFLPSIISIVIMTMVFSFMFDSSFGVVNDLLARLGLEQFQRTWFGDTSTAMPMVFLYCLWTGIGFNVVLLSSAISRIPTEIIEFGQLEGIGLWKEMTRVVIPMIWPTVSTVFVLGSTSAFTIFLQPQLLTNGGPNGSSYTIALYILEQVRAANYEYASTVGIFFAIIGVSIVLLFKKILEKTGPTVEY